MSLPVIRVSAATRLNRFQEETFASAPLQNSLWAGAFEHFTKYMGSNRLQLKCAPTSAWAAFTARNEEWERDTLYCLFIWIHSAIPNDKEGPGRKKKIKSAFTKDIWVSRLYLKTVSSSLPMVHYWNIPSFTRYRHFSSLVLFTTAKSARALTLA